MAHAATIDGPTTIRGTRFDLAVGAGTALAVHLVLGLAVVLAPPGKFGVGAAQPEKEGCAAVISPACVGAEPQVMTPAAASDEDPHVIGPRRCPEPSRRLQRRTEEPPPALAVDLLRAEIVANLGAESGKRLELGQKAGIGGEQAPKPADKLAEALETQTKLGEILAQGTGGAEKKKKLGDILGTATGKQGGEGTVNQSGSTYMRYVGIAVRSKLVLPPSIPPWERKDLWAKVRVTRMTAGGQVLAWSWERKSGNDDFDDTVAGVMNRYKSGQLALPEPPPHVLDQINSQGAAIIVK
jgi:hypothetical protein